MRHLLGLLLIASPCSASEVTTMAKANGFTPDNRTIRAIEKAAKTYSIDVKELTAIAIVETGLGRYTRDQLNSNGTKDVGLFQINEINHATCVEYNLRSPEGSALCAAKLLASLKKRHQDYLVKYHSKTLKHRINYGRKITSVFQKAEKGE